jgi:ABC-type molybdenum transport system ATPase subunit/photorepair protein PhrA
VSMNNKAIRDFKGWYNIEGLNILTGFNGAGKTQLLELINSKFINKTSNELAQAKQSLKITGNEVRPEDVLYFSTLHRLAGTPNASIASFQQQLQRLHNDLTSGGSNFFQRDRRVEYLRNYIIKGTSGVKQVLELDKLVS